MARFVPGLVLAVAAASALAQALEVISLKHRTADQVVESLRPLVEPGGVLTAHGNQLIIRASHRNIAEIRRALDAIDRPQRRLQVSVRFDDAGEASRRELEAGGVVSNRGARLELRAEDGRRTVSERVDQRVTTLDGGRATIMMGRAEDMVPGFEVVPRVSGNMVTMSIYAAQAGTAAASSAASGRLGEWFELGAITQTAARNQHGIGSSSEASASGSRRVWVKVEALD